MSTRQEFVVYLSSTLADLEAEREAALSAIAEFGVVRTSFRASENGVVDTCVQDVRSSNLYVGILGLRYGYQPPENNPQHKSITELEYEACTIPGQAPIPRLMFLKSTEAGIPPQHIDALSHKQSADSIEALRSRSSTDQTAYEFKEINNFKAEIRVAVMKKANQFHQENAVSEPILTGVKPWSQQLAPIAIGCVPGTDEDALRKISQFGGARCKSFGLSPEDADYLATLDQGMRLAQIVCLLLTPRSLNRYRTEEAAKKFLAALNLLKFRTGKAVILCAGVSQNQLPEAWQNETVLEYQTDDFALNTEVTLDHLYARLREIQASLTTEPRLALPYLVIAPTQQEADDLLDPANTVFNQFEDEDERQVRRNELQRTLQAARMVQADWPAQRYTTVQNRQQWRCFGPESKSAEQLIGDIVTRINNAPPGSREQSILKTARILPRPYLLDEYLHDHFGSRSAIESLRDRGCLILIDELALLHPVLRKAASDLLTGSKTAVVAISPCDPAYAPTGKLLGNFSFLSVGTLIPRFKIDHDPRCELVLNSIERVERWLRFAIPELISDSDDMKSEPNLVAQVHNLLN